MELLKKVSSVLNITFTGNYASRAGVRFRITKSSVMVGSVNYNNIYGLITDKTNDTDMKKIANNMANITNIGKLVSDEMKNTQVSPRGRWFVTSYTVRTQVLAKVKGKHRICNAVYSIVNGKQIGELKLLTASEIKPIGLPVLRNNRTVKVKDSNKIKTEEMSMEGFDVI